MKKPFWLLPVLTFVVLSFEIALTRIFGYFFSYELTPIAVAVALFGLGMGAWLRQGLLARLEAPALHSRGMLLVSGALAGVCLVILLTASATALIASAVLVFMACGALAASLFEAYGAGGAHLAYSLDLGGGALGCLAVVPLLGAVGPVGVVLLLACLAAMAAAGAWAGPRRRRLALSFLVAAAVLFLGLAWREALPDALLTSKLGSGKSLKSFLARGGRVIDHEWSVIGRADLYEPPPPSPARMIFSDGGNPSLLLKEPRTPAEIAAARRMFQSLPITLSRPRRMLVLGSGGGLEVALARIAGAREIDAVELSPAIVDLVKRSRDYAGPVYEQPGVSLHVQEGRRFLETHPGPYDLIHMTLVLSDSTEHGTYHLPDGPLYTLEAYRLYLDRLRPDGMLAVIDHAERRMTRHFLTALAAVREREGEGESAETLRHLMVLENPQDPGLRYLLLVSPEPFSQGRLQTVLLRLMLWNVQPLWMPGWTPREPYASIVRDGEERFIAGHPLDMGVRTDNSPHPFHFARGFRATLVSLRHLAVLAVASALLGAVLAWRAGRGTAARKAGLLAWLLGAGFMVLQTGLLQKLSLAVGGPSQTLSVLLFSLLLWCGLGSRIAGAVTSRWDVGVRTFCGLVALAAIATALSLDGAAILARVTDPAPRMFLVVLALAPLGIALGMPFPTLLRTWGGEEPRLPGSLWGLSGLGSLTGAVLAMTGGLLLGIRETVLMGAALYLLIGWLAPKTAKAHSP